MILNAIDNFSLELKCTYVVSNFLTASRFDR